MSAVVSVEMESTAARLVRAATLAPSSHNTQPWRFAVREGAIYLYADRSRALPANDHAGRELTISCGCALFNLRVAAAQAQLRARVRLFPDARRRDLIAVVALERAQHALLPEAELYELIPERRTWRGVFEARPVPAAVLDELLGAAAAEGAWLSALTGQAREQAAALVAQGDRLRWASRQWRRELAAWMRTPEEGEGLAMPAPALARWAVRTFNFGPAVARRDKRLACASPVLAVLGTEEDAPGDWVRAGQALERILLAGSRHGVHAAFLNQPIEATALRSRLQALTRRAGWPQILLRFGYPQGELPAARRRSVDQVLAWGEAHE